MTKNNRTLLPGLGWLGGWLKGLIVDGKEVRLGWRDGEVEKGREDR